MQERRRYPRHAVPGGNYLSYPEGSSAILDLSLGGCLAADDEPLPPGTRIEFSLHVGGELFQGRGIVRRTVPGRAMGIEFVAFAPGATGFLAGYLASLPRTG